MTRVAQIPPWPKEEEQEQAPRRKAAKLTPKKLPINTRPEQPLKIVPTSEVKEWLELLKPNIHELSQLKQGWNGPRSHTVSLDNIAKLLRVLFDIGAHAAPPPQLVALTSGGVQAEWHYYDRILEVGINADGEIFAFADDSGNNVFELEDTWFIPNDQLLMLRRHLFSLAEPSRAHEGLY